MTQCNTLTIKLSNLQFCKLKSGLKNGNQILFVILMMKIIFCISYY